MAKLPVSVRSLLVRTDFTYDETWQQVSYEAPAENSDGFRAYVQPVSDPASMARRGSWSRLRCPRSRAEPLCCSSRIAGHWRNQIIRVLVVDLRGCSDRAPFRCIAAELWGIENNLNIANMDWKEFAGGVDADGIFRGFQ
jgi:hypothetical protein